MEQTMTLQMELQHKLRKAHSFFVQLQQRVILTKIDEATWNVVSRGLDGNTSCLIAVDSFKKYLVKAKKTTCIPFVKNFDLENAQHPEEELAKMYGYTK